MAAYGAANSLLHTLSKLLDTPNCPQQQIENLREQVAILRRFLINNREVKREFETQIRDAIYEAQDIIDSHLLSSEAEISMQRFCQDLERVGHNISSLGEMTTEEFNHQTLDRKISSSVWKTSDEIDAGIGCTTYPPIGRDEDINKLMERLMRGSAKLEVVPIVGIAGIGKTTLAEFILDNRVIREHFDATGSVTISIKYNKRNTLLDLLESTKARAGGICVNRFLKHQYNWGDEIHQKTDDQFRKQLYNIFKNKRYLILLDDIHNIRVWNDLKELFPNYNNGSRILTTTRDVDVANIVGTPHQLCRLSDADSLLLLQKIVFYGEPCPPHLRVTAKNIAWSCRGFPHAIFMVGKLLLCANPITEYWEIVLSSINTCQSYDDIIEALLSLTYNHLPQQLKVCLLYMAIFPYNDTITLVELVNLWCAEGFIEDKDIGSHTWQELGCRGFFVLRIMFNDTSSASSRIGEEVFHDFLVRKAKQEKFFLVINKDTSLVQDDTTYNQQRRLSIQQNIHLSFKDLSKKKKSSFTRSLVYHGPKNQYPLGAWSEDFKMVKVLDALKIRFYTFPLEFLKSIQLRYLAFSYNGRLPTTVCNLRNLEVLIVSHYLNLKLSGVPSYLPVEIWNLKYLWHLQVMGSDLPEPPSGTNHLLENLEQLSDVSAHSCARNILERITKLRALEVRIESSPEDESLGFFSHLNILEELNELKCVVMYPDIGSQVVPCSILTFPSTLGWLTLSGCGFPWEYIGAIAALPELVSLKLQTYAFQGPQWEVKTDEFLMLKFLILEDLDLENWRFASSTGSIFPILKSLSITHCYKLEHIPSVFADILTLEKLQVVDCSTSAMNSALEIKGEILSRKDQSTQFFIYSSRDD